MTNRIAIILMVIVVLFAVFGVVACTSAPDKETDGDTSLYNQPTKTGASVLPTDSAGVQAPQTATPNIPAPEIDYSDFIPEVSFGSLICSFVQNNEGTFLYTDVSYDNALSYAESIKAMDYALNEEEGSKSDDSYQAEFYNENDDVSVYMKYSQSGLSIKVVLEKYS